MRIEKSTVILVTHRKILVVPGGDALGQYPVMLVMILALVFAEVVGYGIQVVELVVGYGIQVVVLVKEMFPGGHDHYRCRWYLC